MKIEHPEMDEASLQEQIKEEMMQELQNICLEEGRKMIKASNILLLPNWDIADALVFNFVSKKLMLENKYETILEAYNREVNRRIELESKLMGKSTRPKITYPHPPVEPFKSNPLLEIPDTP